MLPSTTMSFAAYLAKNVTMLSLVRIVMRVVIPVIIKTIILMTTMALIVITDSVAAQLPVSFSSFSKQVDCLLCLLPVSYSPLLISFP